MEKEDENCSRKKRPNEFTKMSNGRNNNRKLPSWMSQVNTKSTKVKEKEKKTSLGPSSAKKKLPDTHIKRSVYCMTPHEFLDYAHTLVKKSKLIKPEKEGEEEETIRKEDAPGISSTVDKKKDCDVMAMKSSAANRSSCSDEDVPLKEMSTAITSSTANGSSCKDKNVAVDVLVKETPFNETLTPQALMTSSSANKNACCDKSADAADVLVKETSSNETVISDTCSGTKHYTSIIDELV